MPWAVAIAGGSAVIKGVSDWRSAKAKEKAAGEAAAQQRADLASEKVDQSFAYNQARNIIGDAGTRAGNTLESSYRRAGETLQEAERRQLQELKQGYREARSDYTSGIEGAGSELRTGATSALGEIDRGYAGSKLEELWSPTFETDPGYDFRLSQGNEAMARASAAYGGRLSGGALKKMSEYNQGFASNEYGNWFNRNQQIGGQIDQNNQNWGLARAGIQSDLGSGLAGLSERGGQYLSGLGSNFASNNANVIGNTGAGVSSLQAGLGSGLASLYTGTAANQANAVTGNASTNMNLTLAGLPTYAATVPYAGAGWDAIGGGATQIGNFAAFAGGRGMGMGGSTGAAGAPPANQGWNQYAPNSYSRTTGYGGY